MPDVYFSPMADAQYEDLLHDEGLGRMLEAIDNVLDELERDPGQRPLRKIRFQDPPVWAVVVVVGQLEWVLLWSPHETRPGDVMVDYIGEGF